MKKIYNSEVKKKRRGVFAGFWKLLGMIILFGMMNYEAFSQAIKVTGVVVDQNGVTLPGAGVLLKGSSTSSLTDNQGKYRISVPGSQGTLTFSMVGYKTIEIPINGLTVVNATLQEANVNLEDVVVVGFGTQKKVNLTGAISTISGKAMESRPVTNALAALQGAAPGLTITRSNGQPGQEGYVAQIRGVTSVNGASPLVVIDGAPGGDLSLLNPNDIESITVLKDAASASIYGASAAGGVILVTTKSGVDGKTRITYSGIFSANKRYGVPEVIHSWEGAQMQNEARLNAGSTALWSAQQLEWFKDPNVVFKVDPSNPKLYNYYDDFNMLDYVTKKVSPSTNQNISVTGGNEKSQYLMSFGYYGQSGIFKFGPDDTKRYNARLNLSTKLNKHFSLDNRIGFSNTNTMAPTLGTNGANGDYGLLYQLYVLRPISPPFVPGTSNYPNASDNAYAYLKSGGFDNSRTNDLNGAFTLKADSLAKGLTLRVVYNPHVTFFNEVIQKPTVPLYNDPTTIGGYLNQTNSLAKYRYQQFRNNLQGLVDYDLTVGKSNFRALGGYSYESFRYDRMNATAQNLSSNNLFSLNLGDPTKNLVSDDIQTWALLSYFGRVNYNYDNRFLIEGTLRRDGSSRLAPQSRWGLFPAVSAGWRMENETWFQKSMPFFTEFKPRLSWGKLGNSQTSSNVLGNYDYLSLITKTTTEPFNGVVNNAFYNSTLGSVSKTWEVIETTNAGLDFSSLKGRLRGSVDYYVKKNTNMLAPLQISSLIGIGLSQYNVASLRTTGWDLSLGWKDNAGGFSYYVNGNLGDSQNKITKYSSTSVYAAGVNSVLLGHGINSIYGYEDEGYFSSPEQVAAHAVQGSTTGPGDIMYKDQNGDGKINVGNSTAENHGDLVYFGDTSPRYNYAFDFGFSYKGFDFSAMFQGVGQRKLLLYSYAVVPFVESWRQPWAIQQDYWTPENPNAKFPRLYAGGGTNLAVSNHWIQNAAYLRLKNAQIGYTLPAKMSKKVGLGSLRIYATGENVLDVINKMWFKYYDPESPNNVGFNYPFFRTFSVGLTAAF